VTRDEVLAILNQHCSELAAFGLRRLAIFGSVARDEAGPNSDVDILVEFEGEITFKRYARLYDLLEDLLPCSVDLVTEGALRPILRQSIEEDAYNVQELSAVS
jgi:predicted nucleotidyltransferase